MPSYIVKADPAVDWYCLWSTVVDAPIDWGTRAELSRDLHGEAGEAERFARADERGTSVNWTDWPADDMPFGWQDDEFIVMEGAPERDDYEDGCWMLPRENLRTYCETGDPALLRWERHEDDGGAS